MKKLILMLFISTVSFGQTHPFLDGLFANINGNLFDVNRLSFLSTDNLAMSVLSGRFTLTQTGSQVQTILDGTFAGEVIAPSFRGALNASDGTPDSVLQFDAAGNVKIMTQLGLGDGTTTADAPSVVLEITDSHPNVRLKDTDGGGIFGFENLGGSFDIHNYSTSQLLLRLLGSVTEFNREEDDVDFLIGTDNNDKTLFIEGSSDQIVHESPTPQITLGDSDANTGGGATTYDSSAIVIEADGEPTIEFFSSDGDEILTGITAADEYYITGGSVGIGTTDPATTFQIGATSADDVQPDFSIVGDADSDGAGDTDDIFKIALTPNATPTLATWGFTSTQSAGYTFDKAVTVTGLTVSGDQFINSGFGLVIGHTAQINTGSVAEFQVLGVGVEPSTMTLGRWNVDSGQPTFNFVKSRGAAIGDTGIVINNDFIGGIRWLPDDGVDVATIAAQFFAQVDDSSPAIGDIGMVFVWHQMPGGGGGARETMRLNAAGDLSVPEGDIYTTAWTTYGGTSTIVGWADPLATSTLINYKKVGNIVYVQFYLDGVSDATTVTFTLPFTQINTNGVELKVAIQVGDNSVQLTTAGLLVLGPNSATVSCFIDMSGAAWTASNNKRVQGQFWYESQ